MVSSAKKTAMLQLAPSDIDTHPLNTSPSNAQNDMVSSAKKTVMLQLAPSDVDTRLPDNGTQQDMVSSAKETVMLQLAPSEVDTRPPDTSPSNTQKDIVSSAKMDIISSVKKKSIFKYFGRKKSTARQAKEKDMSSEVDKK
jgi:hypothetical protein